MYAEARLNNESNVIELIGNFVLKEVVIVDSHQNILGYISLEDESSLNTYIVQRKINVPWDQLFPYLVRLMSQYTTLFYAQGFTYNMWENAQCHDGIYDNHTCQYTM